MLYTDTGWIFYTDNNELADLYLNIRNINRYIKSNSISISHHKRALFSKEVSYDYIDLTNIFDMERVSYHYREILNRFNPNNINDLDDFFKRLDEFSDFILFLEDLYGKCDIRDFTVKVSSNNEVKDITFKDSHIIISSSVIEQIGKSGSVILDLLDNKNKSDKYVTFYNLILPSLNKKFISGETDTKLTYKEKILISDYTDNLSLYMYKYIIITIASLLQSDNKCMLYKVSNYLEKGIILVNEGINI